MTHMILRSDYFQPTIFKDTFEHVHTCHICQISANKERYPPMPLQQVFEVRLFTKWGTYFIGPINSLSSTRHTFFLTVTNYCTCWIEVETFRNCTTKVLTDFLEEHIVTRFRMSFFLVCDNGLVVASIFLTQQALENQVIIKLSSNYYPQGNFVAISTNKNLITVIRHFLTKNLKYWHTSQMCYGRSESGSRILWEHPHIFSSMYKSQYSHLTSRFLF